MTERTETIIDASELTEQIWDLGGDGAGGWEDEEIADALGLELLLNGECPALSGWWRVTWPEHVRIPKYNADATYHGPYASELEATGG